MCVDAGTSQIKRSALTLSKKYCLLTKNMKFVSGGAKGADSFGEEYAAAHDVKVTVFKPDWKKYGKAAGPIRNKDMLDYASEDNPVVIPFWDGNSKGTRDMISKARKAGARVFIVDI